MSNDVYRSINFDGEGNLSPAIRGVDENVRQEIQRRYDQAIQEYLGIIRGMPEGWLLELMGWTNGENQNQERPEGWPRELVSDYWHRMMHGVGDSSVIPVPGGTNHIVDTLSRNFDRMVEQFPEEFPPWASEEESEEGVGGNVEEWRGAGLHSIAQSLPMSNLSASSILLEQSLQGNDAALEELKEVFSDPRVEGCFNPDWGILLNPTAMWGNFQNLRREELREHGQWYDSVGFNDEDWKKVWLIYARFVLTHETFHYWTERVVTAHYGVANARVEYSRYAKRIFVCCQAWDDCCYNKEGVISSFTLSNGKTVDVTESVPYANTCNARDCEWHDKKGSQYPFEETMANAFALKRMVSEIAEVFVDRQKRALVRNLVRSELWLGWAVGYCEGDKFETPPWFDAGLRDMSRMIRNKAAPPENAMHDLKIRGKWGAKDASNESLRVEATRGLYSDVKLSREYVGAIKILSKGAGNQYIKMAEDDLRRDAKETLRWMNRDLF